MKNVEYIASVEMHSELNLVHALAEEWLGCAVSVEQTDAQISPLVHFQSTRWGMRYSYSVLWSKKSLGLQEYLSIFVSDDVQLIKTPPEQSYPMELKKIFNIFVRDKFGSAECVLKVMVGLYE
jgi:hypothetical protein